VYTTVEDWVIGYFRPMFRRTLGGEYRWCAQWWQHGEAISRLSSLWHAWEVLRLQPGTGIGTWYRDHLDHQLPILLGRSGPFAQCSLDEHIEPRPATAEPPPPGWWDADGTAGDEDADGTRPLALLSPGPDAPPAPGVAETQHGGRPENDHEST